MGLELLEGRRFRRQHRSHGRVHTSRNNQVAPDFCDHKPGMTRAAYVGAAPREYLPLCLQICAVASVEQRPVDELLPQGPFLSTSGFSSFLISRHYENLGGVERGHGRENVVEETGRGSA